MCKFLCVQASVCKSFCVQKLLCVCVGLCVCLCVYLCKHVSLSASVFESLSAYLYVCVFHIFYNLLCSIPCLSLATTTLTSSHLLILTSTHNEHIHMISSNILVNIFMQVFGVCKTIQLHNKSEYLYTYSLPGQPSSSLGGYPTHVVVTQHKLTIPRSPIGCSQCLLQRGFWPWSLMLVNEHIIVNPGAHVICFKYLLNVFICIYIFTYGKNKRNRWTRMQSRKTCLKHFQQSCTFSRVTVPVWSVGRGGLQSLECEDSGDSGV